MNATWKNNIVFSLLVMIGVLLPFIVAPANAAKDIVRIIPSQASVGDTINVGVNGFDTGKDIAVQVVEVRPDLTEIRTVGDPVKKTFSSLPGTIQVTIGNMFGGPQKVTATQDGETVEAFFMVLPKIVSVDSPGSPGDSKLMVISGLPYLGFGETHRALFGWQVSPTQINRDAIGGDGGTAKNAKNGLYGDPGFEKVAIPDITWSSTPVSVIVKDSNWREIARKSSAFTINPRITIAPRVGTVNDVFTVTGRGFRVVKSDDHENVTINFGSQTSVPLISANYDFNGQCEFTFRAPPQPNGRVTVKAVTSQSNPDPATTFIYSAFADIEVIELNKSSGPPGEEVQVIGTGYDPRQDVGHLKIGDNVVDVTKIPDGDSVVNPDNTITTGSRGVFRVKFTVPMIVGNKTYDVAPEAQTDIKGRFKVTVEGVVAPPEELMITVADSTITLNWTANTEPNFAGYKVYYGQSEGGPYAGTGAAEGDSPVDVGDVITATLSGLPVNSATYYFVVTAYDNEEPSNESYFSNEVNNNDPPHPTTNKSPADGAEDVALSPMLEADAFFDDNGDGHAASQWQVDVEGGSFNSVYDSGEDEVNLTSITLPITLERLTIYKWRVRYLDSRGRWSDYSTPTFFTTGCQEEPLHPTGDVSGDGTVSAYDAALIMQYTVGLIDEFPADSMVSPSASELHDYAISLPNVETSVGEKVQVPIIINDATGLLAGGITIKYDTTVLRAIGYGSLELLNGYYWKANTNLLGEIRFAFASVESTKGQGNLLMVEFEILPNTEGRTSPLILENVNLSNSRSITKINGEVRIIPSTFALLQNFPNPFNPETWLPYKLASASPVTISIYNAKGQLIRTISLGNQNAGVYVARDRAAYWNGRDSLGERVSSGVYFYTLRAGDFSAVRKMVILK